MSLCSVSWWRLGSGRRANIKNRGKKGGTRETEQIGFLKPHGVFRKKMVLVWGVGGGGVGGFFENENQIEILLANGGEKKAGI